jgi:predicted nucleic acid-binding protein
MAIKIVVDTNMLAARNSFDALLGNRKELEKILAIPGTELIIPSIVIDELLHQKSAAFKTTKSRLTESSYYKKRVADDIKIRIGADDIDLDGLRSDMSIRHTTIDITNKAAALDKIRQLATDYQAPFQVYSDGKENSDKGFKDAYIALTIDEYLAQLEDGENIFLLTKDARLAEYFQGNSRVVRVQSYDEINGQIERPSASESAIEDNVPTASVRPPSQERVSIETLLTDFRNSGSFTSTHSLVAQLAEAAAANKLRDADYLDILVSAAQNNQISWLLGDSDVREFILPIFKKHGEWLNVEQYNTIAPGLGLEGLRMAPMAPEIDFDEMEAAADAWAELQSDIARGK